MNGIVLLVLLSLATYRVTRLVVKDTFPPVRLLREAIIGEDECKLDDTRLWWLGELLACHWCVSIWIAGALVAVTQILSGSVPYPWLAWLACAAIGALIAHREDGIVYKDLEVLPTLSSNE